MGLLDRLRGKKEPDVWEGAAKLPPRFYRDQDDGHVIGMCLLHEDRKTMLPRHPQTMYQVSDEDVFDWRLLLVSNEAGDLLATLDYFEALELLEPGALATDATFILTPELTTAQLRDLAVQSYSAQ
ncbi:DUF4299 domain-containing protein [Thermophilibacter sp. ET337]|uniref:DUF4299 domain-containing protein n=1 Tax=Thermophilibacter sp. ET337 TaxID=2973084 RepID=UPI0021AD2590|nr:DUF4299 domain-containing protein [Thermophilibacter sp. ET337]MCR8907144.1 DUF4299 domain-containing protein [Thermophilibacter sp. ET337]